MFFIKILYLYLDAPVPILCDSYTSEKNLDMVLSPAKYKLRQKNKILKQKFQRLNKKYIDLKDFLERNKSLIESDGRDFILNQYDCDSKFIFMNELENKNKKPAGSRYSDQIKKFSLTLHYYSPKAYNYCR